MKKDNLEKGAISVLSRKGTVIAPLQKGAIIIIVFIIMVVILLLSSYFLSFSLWEKKISDSQQSANNTYYVAEAGINEAIWKLKNDHSTGDGDSAWADDFIDPAKNPEGGPYWSNSFTRSFGGGTYTVSVQNSEKGTGDLVSVAKIPIRDGKFAQRIVKVSVFKALDSPVAGRAILSGGASGDITISSSSITINDGNLFSGNVLNISLSTININDNPATEDELEGQLLSHGNLLKSSATINSTTICAKNDCTSDCEDYAAGSCPPDSGDLPIVDFESSDPNSFKSRAQTAQDLNQCQILCDGSPCSTKCVLTASQFSGLLSSGNVIVINNKITFVSGSINISTKNVTINGILVSANDINISSSTIIVNRPDSEAPSGIMAERKMDISSSPLNLMGILYSSDQMNISSSSGSITGSVSARKIYLSSLPSLTITLDNDIILCSLGYLIDGEPIIPVYSPVITIDHWEESY
jgi:hypothetical protein